MLTITCVVLTRVYCCRVELVHSYKHVLKATGTKEHLWLSSRDSDHSVAKLEYLRMCNIEIPWTYKEVTAVLFPSAFTAMQV